MHDSLVRLFNLACQLRETFQPQNHIDPQIRAALRKEWEHTIEQTDIAEGMSLWQIRWKLERHLSRMTDPTLQREARRCLRNFEALFV